MNSHQALTLRSHARPVVPLIDVLVTYHSRNMAMVHPYTDRARAWLRDSVGPDAQWIGGALPVSGRYAFALVEGMTDAGLNVE